MTDMNNIAPRLDAINEKRAIDGQDVEAPLTLSEDEDALLADEAWGAIL